MPGWLAALSFMPEVLQTKTPELGLGRVKLFPSGMIQDVRFSDW